VKIDGNQREDERCTRNMKLLSEIEEVVKKKNEKKML